MNKFIILNAVWLAVAGITFAVGRMTAQPDENGKDVSQEKGARGSSSLSAINGQQGKASGGGVAIGSGGGENFLLKHMLAEQGVLAAEGMTAAMREAMAETDPVKRSLMMAQLMQSLTAENAKSALAVLRESPDRRENFQYFALLNYAWGQVDGKAAIANAMEQGGRGGAYGAMSVLSGWAGTDPEGAKEWIAGQEDGREKSMYMNGLVDGLAKSDPAAATEYVLSMPGPEEGEDDPRGRYIDNIAGEMLKQGVDAASTWADGLPEGSLRASALSEVAEYYARQDISAAAAWVEAYAGSEDANRAVREIADRWANDSPQEAAEWVSGLPADSQGGAMRTVFSEWAQEEPVEAANYLTDMAASPARDSAVSGFSMRFAGEDPTTAMEWTDSIANADMREETQVMVARQWLRQDEEAAQAWAVENLSEEAQAQMQSRGGGFDRGGFDRGGGGRGPGGRGGR